MADVNQLPGGRPLTRDFDFIDADGVPHHAEGRPLTLVWQDILGRFLDDCLINGLTAEDGVTVAANIAGYLCARGRGIPDEQREPLAEQAADILRRKAKQAWEMKK